MHNVPSVPDPTTLLLESILTGDPSGGIERMESRGQQELLHSTVLPSEMAGGTEPFEALGFTFGAVVDGDPLFREATLPAGWRREGTEHAMHTVIVDERGVERVSIFYKAAFYDRKAHMALASPGDQACTKAVYGDGPVALNARLNADELREALSSADRYLRDAVRSPGIYGARAGRAREFRALVEAALAVSR